MDNTTRKDIAVVVSDITKTFHLPHESHSGVKQLIINLFRKNKKKGYETQQVLNGVSFEIKKGEFFGIVGRNGSGKSTLLKLLAGIYTPDTGTIQTNGSIVPFIELGVGFNPELTGRENVFLNGALLGFSRDEMNLMYGDIVEFAELEQFMDQKLKNYSSGMQVRLAFSIAIKAQGDILILDEVLAVGDEAFQQKCLEYFNMLKKNRKTVILVTHDMRAVETFCDRAILIDKGEVKKLGRSDKVASAYSDLFLAERSALPVAAGDERIENNFATRDVNVADVAILQHNNSVNVVRAGERFSVRVGVSSELDTDEGVVGINILDGQGRLILATSTKDYRSKYVLKKGKSGVVFDIDNIFTNNTYSITVAVGRGANGGVLVCREHDIRTFEIAGFTKSTHSSIHPDIKISTF